MTHLMAVRATVANHMEKIAACFRPGAKITVLVRSPGYPHGDRDFMMTDDDVGEAIKALQIRHAAGMTVPADKDAGDDGNAG